MRRSVARWRLPASPAEEPLCSCPSTCSAGSWPPQLALQRVFRRHAVLRPGEPPDDRLVRRSRSSCFSADGLAHGIAYLRVGAPVGTQADWTVRGALTQADISSWIVAGSFRSRLAAGGARHRYDIGAFVQHAALRRGQSTRRFATSPTAAATSATCTAIDTFAVVPGLDLTYGTRYARYDYLDHRAVTQPACRADHDASRGTCV